MIPDRYVGWVAWVGAEPIFEARPNLPDLPLMPGAVDAQERGEGLRTSRMSELPHLDVTCFEVYAGRAIPAVQFVRAPGDTETKFFAVAWTGTVATPDGPRSLGLRSYRVGWWTPSVQDSRMWDVALNGNVTEVGRCADPFAPRPHGFGLARWVLGE